MDYVIIHSKKGSTWKDHKYLFKKDGRYYYEQIKDTVKDKLNIGNGKIGSASGSFETYSRALKDRLNYGVNPHMQFSGKNSKETTKTGLDYIKRSAGSKVITSAYNESAKQYIIKLINRRK